MKPTANKRFGFKGIFYDEGDEVNVTTKEDLINLNEKGFIGPLSIKEIQNFGKDIETKRNFRKEEE